MKMSIIESIYKEPEAWKLNQYTFDHKNGLSIWVSNGFFFYDLYPKGCWSLWMKFKFSRALSWWVKNIKVE